MLNGNKHDKWQVCHLSVLKWQILVVSGQDKLDIIVQSRGIFCKFECSVKNYVDSFIFYNETFKGVITEYALEHTIVIDFF